MKQIERAQREYAEGRRQRDKEILQLRRKVHIWLSHITDSQLCSASGHVLLVQIVVPHLGELCLRHRRYEVNETRRKPDHLGTCLGMLMQWRCDEIAMFLSLDA